MNLPVTKKVMDCAEKNMRTGNVWVYHFYLWKGDSYLVEARGSSYAKTINCSVKNEQKNASVMTKTGRNPSFIICPEKDGICEISVSLGSTPCIVKSAMVTITLSKAFFAPWTKTRMERRREDGDA
jgi:hypothetical protein